MTTRPEPPMTGLAVVHEMGRSIRVDHDGVELARYVYGPWDQQLESPRPYLHPLRTLGGELVSLRRPHDDIWHKGLTWAFPNVGDQNFWGGPTFVRGEGYVQQDNNGSIVHQEFARLEATAEQVTVDERLAWVTQAGETWFAERRSLTFTVVAGAWVLTFGSRMRNVSGATVVFGSPTTKGRPNAGYGGLFWRGPRSFAGGTVRLPERSGGDDLMGERTPWMAFTGRHDGDGGASTLVFVDAEDNPGHPTRWFVRTGLYGGGGSAPFFDQEVPVPDGAAMEYRYAVVVADGDPGPQGVARLAGCGVAALTATRPTGGTADATS